jgi:hypothetical protein
LEGCRSSSAPSSSSRGSLKRMPPKLSFFGAQCARPRPRQNYPRTRPPALSIYKAPWALLDATSITMASTFKFLFRPPYIRPDVLKLGDDGDLLACGGIDGRLNVFSLVRGIHLTTMVFPAPISVLTWEPTTLAGMWKLWVGMRDGSVDIISIAVETSAQARSMRFLPTTFFLANGLLSEYCTDTGFEGSRGGSNHPDNIQGYCRHGNNLIRAKDTHGQNELGASVSVMGTLSSRLSAGMQHECTESKILDRWMATIHLQSNPGKDASAGGPIIRTNFGAPERGRTGQTIRITEGVMLTARRDQIRRRSTFSRVGHNKERMRLRNRGPRCRGRCRKAKVCYRSVLVNVTHLPQECRHKHGKL